MKSKKKLAAKWAEAQMRCRLSDEGVQLAKESGITPQVLLRKIPHESEPWNQPVESWVRTVYMKRKEKESARKSSSRQISEEDRDSWFEKLDAEIAGLEREVGHDPGRFGQESYGLPPDLDELDLDYHEWEDQGPPSARDIDVENLMMLKRQRNFRRAAEHVAEAIARQPAVHQIVLFGSAAMPLKKEIPRFRQFRRAGIAIWHECGDIDLAVWVDNLDCLNELRRSLSGALNELMQKSDIGVAHHQVDAHIMEPGANRYRGRLCIFGQCPRPDKEECEVAGCGARPFLRQFVGYQFDPLSLFPTRSLVLFDLDKLPSRGPEERPHEKIALDDDIPF